MDNELIEANVTEEKAPEAAAAPAKKMLDVDRVNDLVKKAKMEGFEKAKREHAAELERLKAAQQSPKESEASTQDEDVMARQIDERIARLAQEHQYKLEQQAEEQRLQKIADSYFQKMERGPELFEDFEEVMSKFKAPKNADIIELAHEFENLPQVMYELAKNPSKAIELRMLAKDDKEDAMYELQKLAKSIAANEQAQRQYTPSKPPLTKPNPSHVSKEKALSSVKDYKNADWLRT